jgi:hypothetical protein
MSLGDIYNVIEKIQYILGNDCKITISIPLSGILQFKAEWLDDKKIFTYVKAISDQELRYIVNENVWIDLFCHQADRAYKIATVGEE